MSIVCIVAYGLGRPGPLCRCSLTVLMISLVVSFVIHFTDAMYELYEKRLFFYSLVNRYASETKDVKYNLCVARINQKPKKKWIENKRKISIKIGVQTKKIDSVIFVTKIINDTFYVYFLL